MQNQQSNHHSQTILLTGATDGIGLETAKILVKNEHTVLLHGRNANKLNAVVNELSKQGNVEAITADLSDLIATKNLAECIKQHYSSLDCIINNAGVLNADPSVTADRMDIRLIVNTLAPYLLTKELLPLLTPRGRIINLSSAAQATVKLKELTNLLEPVNAMEAYSQSKLAITMWSKALADQLKNTEQVIVAINPGSLLASKMVKEGFGIEGKELTIGANILVKAATSEEFSKASGLYFDNDLEKFSEPHPDALDDNKCAQLLLDIENLIEV